MPAPDQLTHLIERFARNRDDYHRGQFNETQLRVDYLNPVFELLGWDVINKAGYAEKYRDVIHEAQVKVGGMTKAPDYCFKIGPERKFFLEAKKPAVNIKENREPAFQLRRYAWSAKLPLSILTDFEEIAVYDCRVKPDRLDRASVARIMYFTFEQFAEKWDEFAAIFSKEAVLQGSFDRYAESAKAKRGTAEVDGVFLEEIESWRDMLAKDIAKRNEELSQSDLNDAVQRTIDRIIFLRICEDRGIEEYGRLLSLRNGANIYPRLMQIFHQADARYNSGLFHFKQERGQAEQPDELTPDLVIDDRPLKEIFRRLYYPESAYEFSVFPASILGQVYEQFLGKVISLDAKHRATIEEKPEVRKAGGVYYTPEYIAEYIVRNTVGKLVEGKTPKDVAKLRVLDPACGSGSFLLVAYRFLLDWHLEWYSANEPEKLATRKDPPIYQGAALPTSGDLFTPSVANWRLTTGEKKRILLNNIYGVDIDRQAVEVTKLSLLLKMLEGESDQSLGRQMKLMHDRVLPDLANNIKCGNSLIGPDFFNDPANLALDLETRMRINAFDWKREFAEVMRAGGFDAVIGNPPYVRSQSLSDMEKVYLPRKYEAAAYQPDLFAFFIEQGTKLLRDNGRLGFIIPNGILTNTYYKELRQFLLANVALDVVVDLKSGVFDRASVDTSIFVLRRENDREARNSHRVSIGACQAAKSRRVETPQTTVAQYAFSEIPDCAFNTRLCLTNDVRGIR
ncbi:MAG TPA: N-6 DNA methylase [Candidatus Kapabacteria bacterium]|nr:N-6 DNA methylase [Candidatus Kapabacteria bacterium]